jgi:hypothetical protein
MIIILFLLFLRKIKKSLYTAYSPMSFALQKSIHAHSIFCFSCAINDYETELVSISGDSKRLFSLSLSFFLLLWYICVCICMLLVGLFSILK